MSTIMYPSLYQLNTRVWLTELTRNLRRRVTLDDIPDEALDELNLQGFDWIWLLSVWQTGEAGQRISRQHPGWRKEFRETLPDLEEADIAGSGFAITRYAVAGQLGGDAALARLRERLRARGLKLMLDFVPNHTAPDHPWVHDHPGFYITAGESDLAREPDNYIRIGLPSGDIVLAHGRDPFFPGWPDTVQLNYGNPTLQDAMTGELVRIAGQCDGVRCDMAMLVLPEVFERTWGIPCEDFWIKATRQTREVNPDFCFLAEVYWDLEWTLLQQGFDFAYDKRLYDRLKEGHATPVREHFYAGTDYQSRMARFLENHDEPRAAAEFEPGKHEAAAVLTYLSPGLRFFHQGQFQGRLKRISPHLIRAPEEPVNEALEVFYNKLYNLLQKPILKNGNWQLLNCLPAWEGNGSAGNFVAFSWHGGGEEKLLVAVNFSPCHGQCFVTLPFHDLGGHSWILRDLLTDVRYDREGDDLHEKGLYLDEPAWKFYVFSLEPKIIG